jgi:hypothetical protein
MKNETKQTAVEWLAEQFDIIVELYPSQFEKINNAIEQAKEMEKEQNRNTADIFESYGYERCYYHGNNDCLDFEQYYNETFGGK